MSPSRNSTLVFNKMSHTNKKILWAYKSLSLINLIAVSGDVCRIKWHIRYNKCRFNIISNQ